ncbi:hypothetical protein BDZ89DRAFT_1077487 [Hymenopellis radicata]|nr:hypothetical protein BDZ89DRAFT_1077487 [Hymenopellis radicata]
MAATVRILIINPNTNESMTQGLKPIVDATLSLHNNVQCDLFTSPKSDTAVGSVNSINSPEDALQSALYCLPHLKPLVANGRYDGFLVACYSEHPLVSMLSDITPSKRVTGIFEASIMASLGLGKFGIVTTGKVWEAALTRGVERFLGIEGSNSTKFAGVESTGLTAAQLHDFDPDTVRRNIELATVRLVEKEKDIKAICVGCAGMVGFDDAIRRGVATVLGEDGGHDIRIVEGVAAGVQWLISACRLASA